MKSVPKNIKNQEVNTSKKSFFKRPAEQSFFSNVQTKLTVGQPGDKYEVEADAMADKVVQRMHQPEAESQTSFFQSFQGNTALQSKCDTCEEEVQTKETEDITDAVQTKAFIDTDSIGNDVSNDTSSAPVPTLSLVSNTQPFIAKSSLEQEEVQTKEEETDEQLMPKLEAPVLQRSAQASVRDEASIRARIVEIAQGELGGVEAKKTDSTGRRIGYRRLLDYFHLAAPNVWPDSVIEFKREGFPSWCGIFSVFVIKTAGIDVGNWQMGKGVSAFNSLKVTSNPQPGDIGYIDQPYQHHCIITEVNGDTIKSIDGNSGWHSEVIEKTRSRSKYSGFFTAFTGSEKYIQKREEGNLSDTSDQNISSQLNSSKGAGSPLPSDTKDQMESSFGADFSGVRIHTDSRAEGMSNALHAQAFTNGNDVYFNKGKYNTTNTEGQHLLAHELTHTIQQGAAVQKKEQISSTTSGIQRLFDFDLSSLNRYARYIPGWTLFTVLMGYNPLLGETVDRNAVNVLDGLMGLAPLGTLIFNKLQEHNIITDAYDWTLEQLEDLNLTSEGVVRMFEQAWEEMDFVRTDPFDFNVGVLTRKFESLYNRVRTFAIRVADKVFTMIKDVLINTVKTLAAAIPGYTLLTKIIHHDPLTDTPVEATTAEIVEEFLLMVGAEQELEKMKETGKLEETATWIDEQLAILDFSLEDITLAFVTAWEAFSVNDLLEPVAALERTVAIFAPFATKVFTFASNVVSKVFELIKQYLLGLLKEAANVVPGYHLLTVILEKDPFTEEHVPRTAENLIRGFMGLIPGGEAQFQQMKESGAIGRLTDWLNAEVEALGLTWEYIKNMFLEIWDSFTIENLMDPAPAFQQIIARFGEPLGRLVRFVVRLVMKVIEIILQLMNFPLDLIQNIISNARQAFADIKKDPIGFLKNILRAIKEGFSLFFTNIGTHLLNGVTDWLFGQLDEAGITPPPDFSFKSILNMVMQILGITAERIMDKIAQRIGPEKMERIRGMAETLSGVWGFVKDVVERGPIAIWEKIKEKLTSLWDIVIDGIKGWIITKIITQVTTKLLSLLDPTGIMAVINSCIAFYKAIESFIQYLREMLEIVNSFVAGVAEIARGSVQSAAKFLEGALSQGLPIAIGFLANQVGLGSLGRKIGEMIDKVREMVDGALDWLVDKAVGAGEAALGTLGIGGGNNENSNDATGDGDGELGKTVKFNDGEENHKLWVSQNGKQSELMVASTPMTVEARLNLWDEELKKPEWGHKGKENKKGRIVALLSDARAKLTGIDTNIDTATTATEDQASQVNTADNQIEQSEESLADTLKKLFKEFDDNYDFKVLYAENLMQTHDRAKTTVDASVDAISESISDKSSIQSWNGLVTKLKETDNAKKIFSNPLDNGDSYETYAKGQAERAAREELGESYTDVKKQAGIENIKNSPRTDAFIALRNQILDKNSETTVFSTLKKAFKSDSDHNRFYPTGLEEVDTATGKRLTYSYEGGDQEFTVDLNTSGFPERVTADHLTLHDLGRGTTQNPDEKILNAGMDSAHIMANMFGGSGYRKAKNIVATSSEYNQTVMASKEREIYNWIDRSEANSFSLDITVKYQNPSTTIALSEIMTQIQSLTREDDERRAISESDLNTRISTRLAQTLQPRLVDVIYEVHLFNESNAWIDNEGFSLGVQDLLFGTK